MRSLDSFFVLLARISLVFFAVVVVAVAVAEAASSGGVAEEQQQQQLEEEEEEEVQLHLTNPSAGVVWDSGSYQSVGWYESGGSFVDQANKTAVVTLGRRTNPIFYCLLCRNVPLTYGSCTFQVPDVPGDDLYVRVDVLDQFPVETAELKGSFTIVDTPEGRNAPCPK